MLNALKETNFTFQNQSSFYRGKVRDVYYFEDKILMVATDRISAFDVILPRPIPMKGQVLNAIAAINLKATEDIVPNWVDAVPDPNVSIGKKCEPFKVEMVIRGYLAGHAWREYKSGKRSVCGVQLPDGLIENQRLPQPIITPTTKAEFGHDEDISREEIIKQGIVSEADYIKLEDLTRKLFSRGTELAAKRGLILVDTKYEFGAYNGSIVLMDEIHTPDSSRYFYKDTYNELLSKNEKQRQLSKEFVREWLISNGFQGKDGQKLPEMTDDVVNSITDRYLELYKQLTGDDLPKTESDVDVIDRIKNNLAKQEIHITKN